MTSLTLRFRPEIEHVLTETARLRGQTLEKYLEQLAEQDAVALAPPMDQAKPPTDTKFDQLLDELSDHPGHCPPRLPVDFSRADVYSDHD